MELDFDVEKHEAVLWTETKEQSDAALRWSEVTQPYFGVQGRVLPQTPPPPAIPGTEDEQPPPIPGTEDEQMPSADADVEMEAVDEGRMAMEGGEGETEPVAVEDETMEEQVRAQPESNATSPNAAVCARAQISRPKSAFCCWLAAPMQPSVPKQGAGRGLQDSLV